MMDHNQRGWDEKCKHTQSTLFWSQCPWCLLEAKDKVIGEHRQQYAKLVNAASLVITDPTPQNTDNLKTILYTERTNEKK
jgi:hypothetical protein